MRLYHYTSLTNLDLIVAARQLRPGESDLSHRRPHAGPDVVWLTTMAEPDAHGLRLAGLDLKPAAARRLADKTAIRFAVEVDDAEPWLSWSTRHGILPSWQHALGRGRRPETWYVVDRPIAASEWIVVDVRITPRADVA